MKGEKDEFLEELLNEIKLLNKNLEKINENKEHEKSLSYRMEKLTKLMAFLTGALYILTLELLGFEVLGMLRNDVITPIYAVAYLFITILAILFIGYMIKRMIES